MNESMIFKAMVEPNTVLGVERTYFLISLAVCLGVLLSGMDPVAGVVAFVLWSVLLLIGKQIYKIDPDCISVLLRHLSYQAYYPATEKIAVKLEEPKEFKGKQ